MTITRNLDACRCDDPRMNHAAFTYGKFNDGSGHFPQEIVEVKELKG